MMIVHYQQKHIFMKMICPGCVNKSNTFLQKTGKKSLLATPISNIKNILATRNIFSYSVLKISFFYHWPLSPIESLFSQNKSK